MLTTQIFHIYPNVPFDFDLNCRVFGYGKPIPEVYEEGVWKRALRLSSGRLVPVALSGIGTVHAPKIEAKIFPETTEREKEELTKKLGNYFLLAKT